MSCRQLRRASRYPQANVVMVHLALEGVPQAWALRSPLMSNG